MELLAVLRARAHHLDSLGSPFPVARLLGGLCSSSFESAATAITLMAERFTRGLLREGPVWGLPKEMAYAISGPPQRAAIPESVPKGVPVAPKVETAAGKPRKGKYRQNKGKQGAKTSKEARPEEKAPGASAGKPDPKGKPRAASKGTPDSRPPRKDKKGKP